MVKKVKGKKPSEKSVFKSRVAELEDGVGFARQELEHSEAQLEHLKRRLSAERERGASCVRHLLRVLGRRTAEADEVRERLRLVEDARELDEQKVDELSRNLDRNREVGRSLFQQEKSQLEDKLSRLEDRRLKRNSQLAHLKHLEDTLRDRLEAERLRSRRADSESVSRLLERRDAFVRLVDGLASEAEEVFGRSLPVHAKRQLRENVRLRAECRAASDDVLVLQDRRRTLKRLQKVVDVEAETQKSTEGDVESTRERLDHRFRSLMEENSNLMNRTAGLDPEDLQALRKELKRTANETAQVEDYLANVAEIREDQVRYQELLEGRIRAARDRNGHRMSVLLKAGEMVKARRDEVQEQSPDVDLLVQMAMLLKEDNETQGNSTATPPKGNTD